MIFFPKTSEDRARAAITIINMDPDAEQAIPLTSTNVKQMQFLLDVFQKFIERNDVYVDLWKEGGVADSVRNADSKVERLRALGQSLSQPIESRPRGKAHDAILDSALDSAIDLANYAGFAARNLHSRRYARRA